MPRRVIVATLIAALFVGLSEVPFSYGGIQSGNSVNTQSAATSLKSTSAANNAPRAIAGEEVKEKKSNWWKWALGAAVVLGVGYIIYDKLVKPKPAPSGEQDYLTNLNFRVFNHTQAELAPYTLQNVKTGTDVTIKVSDLGVTGVDPNRIVIRGPVDNCAYLAFSKNGEATFHVLKDRDKLFGSEYTIFLMNAANGTDYSLIDTNYRGPKLNMGSAISYIRGPDLIPGPEWVIANSEKTGAVDQLNAALVKPWMTYGRLTEVDSSGHLRIYYTNETTGGRNGYKNSMWFANVNPTNMVDQEIRRGWIAEVFEAVTNSDDLGGPSSHATITDRDANLNKKGEDLFCYVFVIDLSKLGVTK